MFDSTVSSINDSLWDPKFMLPPMVGLLIMVGTNIHMFNLDLGGGGSYNF